MTDVRTLLREACPPPPPSAAISRVLDAARERRRNRRRRFWLWTTGLVALGAGGSLTDVLVHASRPSTHVEATRPVTRDGDAATLPTAVDAVGGGQAAQADGRNTAARSNTEPDGGAAAPTGSGKAAASASEGCRVDETSTSNLQLSDSGAGGAGWDRYPSCSYVASSPGGYDAKGSWRIEIVRDGNTFLLDSADAPGCGQNVIQPGDTVTAYLRKGVNSPDDWYIAVGADARC